MTFDWTTVSSGIAAFSSLVSVIATIFIVRLTARYARSADVQAAATLRQSEIASRSIDALELQIREQHESGTAITITAAVAVMVNMKIWLRFLERSPLPQKPTLIPSALLQASFVTVQFSLVDAHRLRRIFETLVETEGDLDVLRHLEDLREDGTALPVRSKVAAQLKAAHREALEVIRSLAPEHAAQLEHELSLG